MSRLQFNDRWEANNPEGKRGGLLVAWNPNVALKQIRKLDFSMELRVASEDGGADL